VPSGYKINAWDKGVKPLTNLLNSTTMNEDVTPENIEASLTTEEMIEELNYVINMNLNPDAPSSKFLVAVQIRLRKKDELEEAYKKRDSQLEFILRQKLLS